MRDGEKAGQAPQNHQENQGAKGRILALKARIYDLMVVKAKVESEMKSVSEEISRLSREDTDTRTAN